MTEPVNAQVRLDKIVVQVAANMVAEVCSVYVQRNDGSLELYATEGLSRDAVHQTTMRTGEGLVGAIAQTAEPLALTDAQQHPAFSYRPETGEEIYHSFLGVPILRGGNTLGVLVVQNQTKRNYSEEEVEVLETISMLLAEMIASGELQAISKPGTNIDLRAPTALKGLPIADGVGLGHVVLHQPRVTVDKIVAENIELEQDRLSAALEELRSSLDTLIEHQTPTGESMEVLEAYRLFANDRGWLRLMREPINTGITAEAAVDHVQSDARARMLRSRDPYLRERLHDLDELANRLLHQLAGQDLVAAPDSLPDNAILVARSMGAMTLLDYDRDRLRGLILEESGPASHVAIVAKALGIPTAGEVEKITDLVEEGDAVIVDGTTGEVQVRPQSDIEEAYREKARLQARRQEQYLELRDVPAVTKDGVKIGLHMNAGLLVDLPHMEETGAQSIGLFRTELQFMMAAEFPRQERQYELYKTVIDAVPGKPVTFRTLDIGGDKILPYMATYEEENPALGWRAIRLGIDRPALLRVQLRALLRAASGSDLRIMFPMVTTADEFRMAKRMAEREVEHLQKHNYKVPADLQLGVMLEVPSLLWQLDELLQDADFISVGSNDLMQYLFAADRDNRRVAHRYDPLSAPGLRALQHITDRAAVAQKPVTLCGEMGGKPLDAMALMAIGYRNLSMAPANIGPVKAMLLDLDLAEVSDHVASLLTEKSDAPSLRKELQAYAEAKGVPL